MSARDASVPRDNRGILIALAGALLCFLVLGSATEDAAADRHGFGFLRLGALLVGVLCSLVALGGYLGRRGGWFRAIGVALPLLWIVALFVDLRRAVGLFEWLL